MPDIRSASTRTRSPTMHPSAAAHLARVPRYVPGRMGGAALVPMASNENPDGASPRAMAAAMQALNHPAGYPLDGAPALAAFLARVLGVDGAGVRVTNGATEAITLLCRAFVGEVVMPVATFPAYARAALAAGSTVREVARVGAAADLREMADACGPATRLLFLANPDNPTGTSHNRDSLASFLRRIPHHVIVVVDEAYIEYAENAQTVVPMAHLHPNLVVLRSFSKAYGLAALRVGAMVTTAAIAEVVDRLRDPFNVNAVGAAAALAALEDRVHLRRTVRQNALRRAAFAEALVARGFAPLPSDANFVCVPMPVSGHRVAEVFAAAGIGVRALDGWGMPDCIRVTLGTDEQLQMFLQVLDTVIPLLVSQAA